MGDNRLWKLEFVVTDNRDTGTALRAGETEGEGLVPTLAHLLAKLDLEWMAQDRSRLGTVYDGLTFCVVMTPVR